MLELLETNGEQINIAESPGLICRLFSGYLDPAVVV